MAEARRPVLVAVAALAVAAGGTACAAGAPRAPSALAATESDCESGVTARDFRVFACMSGGARAGHPHPKELLVVRKDGSTRAYPAFRVGALAVGDGEVVAVYNIGLVRATSSRLIPLATTDGLARLLRVRPTAIMGVYHPRVDAHGDVYFAASVLRGGRRGCRNPLLERTAGGTIRLVRLFSRTDVCS